MANIQKPKGAKSEPGAVKDYTVINAVNHDGKLYTKGKPISLNEEEAAPLLAVGAIFDPEAEDGQEQA